MEGVKLTQTGVTHDPVEPCLEMRTSTGEFSGDVGIGVSPDTTLHLAKSNADCIIHVENYNDTGGTARLRLRSSRSDTIGTKVATTDGTQLALVGFQGVNSSSAFDNAAEIVVIQSGAATANTVPGDMFLHTWGDSARNTNQLVLHHDGNVLIGTATDSGFKLDVNGTARVGTLTTTGDIEVSKNTPSIKLTDSGTPRTWTIGVNGTTGTFFITDQTVPLNMLSIKTDKSWSTGAGGTLTAAGVWTDAPSWKRFKRKIVPLTKHPRLLEALNRLEPVSYINKSTGLRQVHFIVDDYMSTLKDTKLVEYEEPGIAAGHVATLAIAGWQNHEKRLSELERKVETLLAA